MSPSLARRPIGRVLAVAAAAFLACGCEGMLAPQEKKEDEKTRKAHFEENAQTYYDGGRYEDAALQWRKVLEIEPSSQKATWGLAKSWAMAGSPESLRRAEGLYFESVKDFPASPLLDHPFVHPTRGDIHFEIERDAAQVCVDLADWLEKAIKANEARISAGKATDSGLIDLVRRQREKRNDYLRRSIPLFESVLRKSPENPYALAGLAKANLLMGDEDHGIAYARRYIDISMVSQRRWQGELDDIVKKQGAATDEERELIGSRIRGAKEKEIGMRLLVASVLMRRKQWNEAAGEYTRVLELDPARPAAYAERAQAWALVGDYKKAVLDLEAFLKITDPIKQRDARINAAELLERYRLILAGVDPDRRGATPGKPR